MRRDALLPQLGTAAVLLCIAMALTACASNRATEGQAGQNGERRSDTSTDASARPPRPGAAAPERAARATDPREEIVERGSGLFLGPGPPPSNVNAVTEAGDINLRFDATDIKEFIAIVLGDILGVNYAIDPAVTGTVTVQTSTPITMDEVLPLFEEILSLNNASLVRAGGLYQVVPRAAALNSQPWTVERAGEAAGFRTQVIPLQFISAQEMQNILESVVADPGSVTVDSARNLVIVSGSAAEVQTVRETIDIFDVDWLRGMSVGLYPLDYVDPATLERELTEVLDATTGQSGGDVLGGIVRLVPLERLTSLLVVSSTPAALREVEIWIRRLDRPGESAGRRLYVYPMQNAKASDLAEILNSVFQSRAGARGATQAAAGGGNAALGGELAPGLVPVEIGPGGRARPSPAAAQSSAAGPPTATATAGVALAPGGPIEIIADDMHNSLVILATPQDYRMVESALRRLDVVPLQVLIEARILEVTLRDDLSYGVEWFFKNGFDNSDEDGFGALDLGSPGIAALAPGFSYTIVDDADQIRVALNLLASESEVKVLSSPSLMVLDNQEAMINVGDEIPVPSRQSVSNIDPISPTVNEITYRQTGVTLTVTPRVNNSGLVTMEIRQEVANAATTTTSNIDAPTIQNREIQSVVAIHSGDTIVLGGLMQDQESVGESGLPFLHRIPVLGKLFGRTDDEHARTELLVLITPRVVRNRDDARAVTQEFRQKLRQIRMLESEQAEKQAEERADEHDS